MNQFVIKKVAPVVFISLTASTIITELCSYDVGKVLDPPQSSPVIFGTISPVSGTAVSVISVRHSEIEFRPTSKLDKSGNSNNVEINF